MNFIEPKDDTLHVKTMKYDGNIIHRNQRVWTGFSWSLIPLLPSLGFIFIPPATLIVACVIIGIILTALILLGLNSYLNRGYLLAYNAMTTVTNNEGVQIGRNWLSSDKDVYTHPKYQEALRDFVSISKEQRNKEADYWQDQFQLMAVNICKINTKLQNQSIAVKPDYASVVKDELELMKD